MRADDSTLAIELAQAAGEALIRLRRTAAPTGPDLAAAGDQSAQAVLSTRLAQQRPNDSILSEEAVDDRRRLTAERVWIIDPLDGTREYAEGRHDWAVHIALWERGSLALGVVALPGLGLTLVLRAAPAPFSGTAGTAAARGQPDSTSRARAGCREPSRRTRRCPMGSAGFKVAAVVLGNADVYLHAGGQYEWDSAAPVAVAQAAGLHASRIDGSAAAL